MGRSVGPVWAVLALVSGATPGCSRTGLDDVALLPLPAGSPSPDGSSSGDDAPSAPSSGNDGGEFFAKGDADDASELSGDGADGQSLETCAATCAGCCTATGACLSGVDTSECGNGGQECMECQPELACSPAGVCQ
jgi:hypothetical protein